MRVILTLLTLVAAFVLTMCAHAQALPTNEPVPCHTAARIIFTPIDESHARMHLAVQTQCENGMSGMFTSREAIVDVRGSEEIGAMLLGAMAVQVARDMQEQGFDFADPGEILEHAQTTAEESEEAK